MSPFDVSDPGTYSTSAVPVYAIGRFAKLSSLLESRHECTSRNWFARSHRVCVLCLGCRARAGYDDEAVRAHRRAGGQGRRLGAHASGAGRKDARYRQGHPAGLSDGPRLGRWPHGHHRGQARAQCPGRRIQPGYGRAVEEECHGRRRERQGELRERPTSSRPTSRRRRSSRCSCCPRSTCGCVRRFSR